MTTMQATLEVEIRSDERYVVADVNFPKRVVTCIAMPYEDPAEVFHEGRFVTEVVSRTAFNGIEERTSRVKAYRDHIWDKVVGKLVGLHPSRREGLVTEVKIFGTPLGDETLTLCDEGGLDASAGFALLRRDGGRGPVWDDAETWEQNRSVRRLNRLHLDHLALVPNPAYAGATVLSVRQDAPQGPQEPFSRVETAEGTGGTPNLDRLAYEAQKAQKDEIDRRWLT